MGCFDDYSDAAPRAKTMRGNGITTLVLHVDQCITFHLKKIVTATLIAKALLNSFYSRLGFKFIKYLWHLLILRFLASNFIMSQEYPKHCRKTIGLQCYLTIPWRVTFLYENQIDLNENKDVFKYLNEFLPWYYWFPYEYINAEAKKKVEKTKRQLSGDEMEKRLNIM